MPDDTKVLLLGGTSHVGKSTLAKRLAEQLGWNCLSTDQLARHPGRPWRHDNADLPQDVIAHYSELTAQQLLGSVMQHYRQNVWPIVDALVRSHVNNPYEPHLVFEGSAILPALVAAAGFDLVCCVWLTAADDLVTERIIASSQFAQRSDSEKRLVEAFIARSVGFNRMLVDATDKLGLRRLDVAAPDTYAALVDAAKPASG